MSATGSSAHSAGRLVPLPLTAIGVVYSLRIAKGALMAAEYRNEAREGAVAEPEALMLIARAADGSVRDGLSLLDQAIAQAEGPIARAQVADMLGQGDRDAVFDLLEAVLAGKPAAAACLRDYDDAAFPLARWT